MVMSTPFSVATSRFLRLCAASLVLGMVGAVAVAATAGQRKLIEDYLRVLAAGDRQDVILNGFHSAEVEKLRTRVIAALDAEKAAGHSTIRERLFGSAASLEELRRLTPPNLLLAMTRRISLPTIPAGAVEVIDTVEEDDSTQHAVVRVWADKKKKGPSRLVLITLRKYPDKQWRIGIPDEFMAQVDAAIEGSVAASAAAAEKPATANSPEILQLLDAGSTVLRDGNCTSYYTVYMSPNFRASKSDKALKTLIQQCERSIDMREMYVSALNLARRSSPEMRADGTRAVYDLKGQGLPFDSFTLEKIGDRWYVAE